MTEAGKLTSSLHKVLVGFVFLGTVSSAAAQFTSAPSFGIMMTKKKVTLVSKLPAIFPATGKTVALSIAQPTGHIQQELQIAIEKQLTQNDSTIQVSPDRPDLVIDCVISRYQEPKLSNVREADGSTTTRMIGELDVLFHVTEVHSRRIVKSDTAAFELSEPVSKNVAASGASKLFGMKMPATKPTTTTYKSRFETPEDGNKFLFNAAATQIAGYVVNTNNAIDVSLAVGGPLNRIDNYATSALWTKDLEELEVMQPYADAREDAYRIYNIGVANEALAYQTTETKAAIRYLQQASNDYSKALDTKPEEKGFLEPQRRIKLALEHYDQIGKIESVPATAAPAASKEAEGTLSNADVLDMVKNRLDEANILDTIEHAPAVNFDLSAQGQIALSRGGVNGKVLLAMKQRARSGASTPNKR